MSFQQTFRTTQAAGCLVLAAGLHLGLLLYLAAWKFPCQQLLHNKGQSAAGVLSSVMLNMIGVVLLGLWTWEALPQLLDVELLEVRTVEEVEAPQVLAVKVESLRESGGGAELPTPVAVGQMARSATEVELADVQLTEPAKGNSIFGLEGMDWDREIGGEGKILGGPGASFFGITAGGNNFVFVVDMSGSMRGRRFERARAELRRTMFSLVEAQKYFIVFYSTQAYPMPAAGLLEATKPNLMQTARWLNKIEPMGYTVPLPALLQALDLKPDAVFLLSDGQFDPLVVDMVMLNQAATKVPIHTIGFESREGEPVLKALAARSGGTYRFVP